MLQYTNVMQDLVPTAASIVPATMENEMENNRDKEIETGVM